MSTGHDALDHTHDPLARSWVGSANVEGHDFPIQNLPFGVGRAGGDGAWSIVVAIGDSALVLREAARRRLLDGLGDDVQRACEQERLNELMALGRPAWTALRQRLHDLLHDNGGPPPATRAEVSACVVDRASLTLRVPADVGDYTDFYASIHHATNVGRMMRPDNPLLPNYKWVPIGYHGRASSVVVSGTPIRRPSGQTRPDGTDTPVVGPTGRLDYELEVAAFVGVGNTPGEPIPLNRTDDHLFGVCLLNDWSARDLQAWEYQPLGPFLAKNFATTVSPWIVTMEALRPYRVPRPPRPAGDPDPLPYLDGERDRRAGALDLVLDVSLSTTRMREQGTPAARLSRSRFAGMYWTLGQLMAHHTCNGCNLRSGDLLASGTVSGPGRDERGCLLELSWRGSEPIELPTGEVRRFLEAGDEVVFRGRAVREGWPGFGLGECRGLVVA
jgi:fumarylacetoacetase